MTNIIFFTFFQDKYKSLKNAVESHKKYAADAIRAQGVDRHLLGLKKIAMENGMNVPDLFSDKGYIESSNFRLSTSQVPSQFEAFMCYGPLTENGYGVCYNPIKNSIVFGISAFKNPETDANKFKLALQETLLEMEKIGSMFNMQSKLWRILVPLLHNEDAKKILLKVIFYIRRVDFCDYLYKLIFSFW